MLKSIAKDIIALKRLFIAIDLDLSIPFRIFYNN